MNDTDTSHPAYSRDPSQAPSAASSYDFLAAAMMDDNEAFSPPYDRGISQAPSEASEAESDFLAAAMMNASTYGPSSSRGASQAPSEGGDSLFGSAHPSPRPYRTSERGLSAAGSPQTPSTPHFRPYNTVHGRTRSVTPADSLFGGTPAGSRSSTPTPADARSSTAGPSFRTPPVAPGLHGLALPPLPPPQPRTAPGSLPNPTHTAHPAAGPSSRPPAGPAHTPAPPPRQPSVIDVDMFDAMYIPRETSNEPFHSGHRSGDGPSASVGPLCSSEASHPSWVLHPPGWSLKRLNDMPPELHAVKDLPFHGRKAPYAPFVRSGLSLFVGDQHKQFREDLLEKLAHPANRDVTYAQVHHYAQTKGINLTPHDINELRKHTLPPALTAAYAQAEARAQAQAEARARARAKTETRARAQALEVVP